MSLLLLKHETAEAAHSPELRYLAACCRVEAQRVFGEVREQRWRPGLPALRITVSGPVLVFGATNVFLGRRSLRAMRHALEAGGEVVVPTRLGELEIPETDRPHTLRGFERLERRLLETEPPAVDRCTSHLPVALLSRRLVESLPPGSLVETLLTDGELLERLEPGTEIVRAGICHEFIDYYGEAREDILELLPPGVRTVLEIGCGRGATGRLLEQRLGCRVTGVELNPAVARDAARHLSRVIVGDVRSLELEDGYDAVVATELLEHLDEPEPFLLKMRSLLRPGGAIVLSVPNVGHHSIVEDLLAGRWDYLPIGLLCYTHLRFFTRATLVDWITRLGFSSFEIRAQSGSVPDRFRGLADRFEVDLESLRTTGFYVVLRADGWEERRSTAAVSPPGRR